MWDFTCTDASGNTAVGLAGVCDTFAIVVKGKTREETLLDVAKSDRASLAVQKELQHFSSPPTPADVH